MKSDQVSPSLHTSGTTEAQTVGLSDKKRDKFPTLGNNCYDVERPGGSGGWAVSVVSKPTRSKTILDWFS